MEANLELLALVETLDNGKPIRETTYADMPLCVDHWRYFAGVIARPGRRHFGNRPRHRRLSLSMSRSASSARSFPGTSRLLMAVWKLAPALAAGNCVVLKPAEQTPLGILVLAEMIADLLPPGVLNIVNGFGLEAGKPLAQSKRIAKIAFTGETTTGRLIMQYASENIIPVTLELGGKSPNIFFADVMDADDEYLRQGARRLRDVRAQPGRGLHLPEPRAGAGIDLRQVHGARGRAHARRSSRAIRST